MAPKPPAVPLWNTSGTVNDGVTNVEPNGSEKASGWTNGQQVSFSKWNWLSKLYGDWCAYLNEIEATALNWSALQTFTGGLQYPSTARVSTLFATDVVFEPGQGAIDLATANKPFAKNISGNPSVTLSGRFRLPAGATITGCKVFVHNTAGVATGGGFGRVSALTYNAVSATDGFTALHAYNTSVPLIGAGAVGWFDFTPGSWTNRTVPSDGLVEFYYSMPGGLTRFYAARLTYTQTSILPST